MAGLAGIVLASRMYSGQPTAGDGAEMDAIAAVVVGGTSMAGGAGKIGGTIIGGLIIGVLNNGLNLLNVNSFWQYVVKGFVILLAVFLDYIKTEILRQYFINHPQSIDKYTFLQNSAFTHWVKEKCSKMC